jgi:1,2-diacylglycerol 3-alpha-glucosyltransferase
MKDIKHILIVTPGFPADESDDTCMPYLQTYLKEAARINSGLRFTVIALQYPYESRNYTWNRIQVFSCGGRNRPFPLRFYYWRKALNQLSHFHQKEKIDVVHSFWLSECTYLAQKWTTSNNVRHIATAMGQDVLPENKYLKRINLDSLSIAVLSKFQNEEMRATVGKDADEIISFGMTKRDNQSNKRSIDVLGVGSLIKLKNYEQFLKVVALVLKAKPELKVVLIGDGPELENLKLLAETLGIKDCVSFLGHVTRKDVLDLMTKAKVLLHTSTFESQGFVFNEAIASGMAVVARKVGIASESERWKVSESGADMAGSILSLLEKNYEPETLIPIQQTIEAYKKLYG